MQERAEMMSGSLKVKTAPGKGTKLILQLPISANDKNNNKEQHCSPVNINLNHSLIDTIQGQEMLI
jgi:hypothetical protein